MALHARLPVPQFAFAPNWGEVTPFVLKRSSQFRPQAPYHLASRKYAADYNEIKRLGGDDVTTPSERTDGPDRDRPVLDRELAAGVEPAGASDLGQQRASTSGRTRGCSGC